MTITARKLNHKTHVWIVAGSTIGLWAILDWVADLTFLTKVSGIVTVETFTWLAFMEWMWRWPLFKGWLVAIPDLNGTWEGVMHSTWKNPETGQDVAPIDTELIVKQTYNHISCTMKTGEMKSQSFAADFIEDPNSLAVTLVYSYASVPDATVRHRSPIHFGTAKLEIDKSKKDELRGEYWTDRKTTGSIALKRSSRAQNPS